MERWCAMALPDRPSLEFLKKLAKDRLPEMRRADPSARLADAQLAIAREHGFTSWRALRAELDRRLAPEPDHVVQLFAAIRGGDGAVVDRLLAAHPALANARRGGQHPAVGRGRLASRGPDPAPAPPGRGSTPGIRPLRPHPALLGGGDRGLRLRSRPPGGRRRAGPVLPRGAARGGTRARLLRPPGPAHAAGLGHPQ